jgi:hypothetical protein
MNRECLLVLLAAVAVVSANVAGRGQADVPSKQKTYELRTYYVVPGRMPAMLRRFKDHTTGLLEKHGMVNVGYWTPQGKEGETKLIYLLAHESKETANKSWQGFRTDPVWTKARDESEKDGKIVEKVESVYLTPTDFSRLK